MEFIEIIVLVVSFIILLAIGVPIAFSIGISVVLTMLVSIAPEAAFTTLAQRMATGLDSFALLAIPFFILAGRLTNLVIVPASRALFKCARSLLLS